MESFGHWFSTLSTKKILEILLSFNNVVIFSLYAFDGILTISNTYSNVTNDNKLICRILENLNDVHRRGTYVYTLNACVIFNICILTEILI